MAAQRLSINLSLGLTAADEETYLLRSRAVPLTFAAAHADHLQPGPLCLGRQFGIDDNVIMTLLVSAMPPFLRRKLVVLDAHEILGHRLLEAILDVGQQRRLVVLDG